MGDSGYTWVDADVDWELLSRRRGKSGRAEVHVGGRVTTWDSAVVGCLAVIADDAAIVAYNGDLAVIWSA